jgi:hypothetical protein
MSSYYYSDDQLQHVELLLLSSQSPQSRIQQLQLQLVRTLPPPPSPNTCGCTTTHWLQAVINQDPISAAQKFSSTVYVLSDCKTYTQVRRLQDTRATGEYTTEQILYEINLCNNLDLLMGNITEFLLARQPKTNFQTPDDEEEDDSAVLCYAAIIKTTDPVSSR